MAKKHTKKSRAVQRPLTVIAVAGEVAERFYTRGDMSITDLAEKSGVSRSIVNKFVNGRPSERCQLATASALLEVLGCHLVITESDR